MCSQGCKEYSIAAHPSYSPLPNTGTLSLLWVQTFCQVPSVVAFHSPPLSILFLPLEMHCFLSLRLSPHCQHQPDPRD